MQMINVKDRVPTQVLANGAVRWEMFNENGESQGYVWLKRADDPSEIGTPQNKVLFDNIKDCIIDAKSNLDVLPNAPENPENGQIYYDTYYKDVFIYLNGAWVGIFQSYYEYNSNIIATTGWSGDNSVDTASNNYGTWTLTKVQNCYAGSLAIRRVSDGDFDTQMQSISLGSSDKMIIDIECSNRIKPSKMKLSAKSLKSGYIYGLNESTGNWDVLNSDEFSYGSTQQTEEYILNASVHYKHFRIEVGRQSSSNATAFIYEIQFTEGNIILPKNL